MTWDVWNTDNELTHLEDQLIPKTISLFAFPLTVFVANCHNPVHIISVVDNKCRQVLDIHAYIGSLFYLVNKPTNNSTFSDYQQFTLLVCPIFMKHNFNFQLLFSNKLDTLSKAYEIYLNFVANLLICFQLFCSLWKYIIIYIAGRWEFKRFHNETGIGHFLWYFLNKSGIKLRPMISFAKIWCFNHKIRAHTLSFKQKR